MDIDQSPDVDVEMNNSGRPIVYCGAGLPFMIYLTDAPTKRLRGPCIKKEKIDGEVEPVTEYIPHDPLVVKLGICLPELFAGDLREANLPQQYPPPSPGLSAPATYIDNVILLHPINRANPSQSDMNMILADQAFLNSKYLNKTIDHYYMRNMALALFRLAGMDSTIRTNLEAAEDQVILQIEAGGKRWLLQRGDNATMVYIMVRAMFHSAPRSLSMALTDDSSEESLVRRRPRRPPCHRSGR